MQHCLTNWPKMTRPKKNIQRLKVAVVDIKTEISFFLIKWEIMEMMPTKSSMLEPKLLSMVLTLKDRDSLAIVFSHDRRSKIGVRSWSRGNEVCESWFKILHKVKLVIVGFYLHCAVGRHMSMRVKKIKICWTKSSAVCIFSNHIQSILYYIVSYNFYHMPGRRCKQAIYDNSKFKIKIPF